MSVGKELTCGSTCTVLGESVESKFGQQLTGSLVGTAFRIQPLAGPVQCAEDEHLHGYDIQVRPHRATRLAASQQLAPDVGVLPTQPQVLLALAFGKHLEGLAAGNNEVSVLVNRLEMSVDRHSQTSTERSVGRKILECGFDRLRQRKDRSVHHRFEQRFLGGVMVVDAAGL